MGTHQPDSDTSIYARISEDRAGGGLGVARQEADCRALAERLGWGNPVLYDDNDVSAYSGKARPSYERLLADIEAGFVKRLLIWHPDRLHRSPAELERFIEAVERHHVEIASVTSGDLDLSTPSGRMVARQLGAVARYEVELKAQRQARKARELAESGAWSGGGSRPFGYTVVRDENGSHLVINEEEAQHIRWAKDHLLDGGNMQGIIREFKRRGVTTATGNAEWSFTTVKRMMCSGLISAQREHQPRVRSQTKRRIVGEIVAQGNWPPIITVSDTEAIRDYLLDPSRSRPQAARRHLLSGIVKCGRCGQTMAGSPCGTDRQVRYICYRNPGLTGRCGSCFIRADALDTLVLDMVREALNTPDFWATYDEPDDATSLEVQLAEAQETERALAGMLGRGEMTANEWKAAREAVQERIRTLRKKINSVRGDGHMRRQRMRPLLENWDDLDLNTKRAFLTTYIDSVVIGPGRRGYNRFDPDRATVIWAV